ncbi:MAG: hypothetical protein HY801_12085 [Candidatus Lindowbacteria bacterium]|nr:hypothetical protein [Candidatus Lindowbacteria bacterium]
MRKIPIFTAVLLVAVSFSSLAHAQIDAVTSSGAKPEFSPSVNCAKCHLDIHTYWKDSMHAGALSDNIFQAAFMLAIRDNGDSVRQICLDCHAPTTAVTNDIMLKLPVSSEAVTCDFCHRISALNLEGKQAKVTLTAGAEKLGPLKPGKSAKSHPSVQSSLFTDSKICATCHQWSNAQGVAIFDTYREWLNGPYAAKGVNCQSCHMPLVEGSIVVGKRDESRQMINSHNLSGGHSIVQVASAAKVRVASVAQVPGGLHAIVEVSNVASGHMIPTGMPSRALVLDVQLVDSKGIVVESEKHTFERVVLDKDHNVLTSDADIILNGAVVSKDNRIAPGGAVQVSFDFAASARQKYLIRATLQYSYKPLVLKEEEIHIGMGSDTKSP